MQTPLTISELTRQLKDLIALHFSKISVVGEISNYTRASSGHVYLTLKDDQAQLRAVIWKSTASRLKFELHDGLEIIATGPIDIYPARGSYQLIAQSIQPQGMGTLELAFRQLQEKLAAAGLFDPAHKKPLPAYPRKIALVTSPTSAAVRDLLQVLMRRWPAADILVLPVAVQGSGAAAEIAAAIDAAPSLADFDVLITGRGGGSLEDLWAFNEEIVARAIYNCPIPVVSAVGHEIDVTIADLVADRRALTPSEAAERTVPDQQELRSLLQRMQTTISMRLSQQAVQARGKLDLLANHTVLARPYELIHHRTELLDELSDKLNRLADHRLEQARHQLVNWSQQLDALSPLKVLQRGYSITIQPATGQTIRSATQVTTGDFIKTRLHNGELLSEVRRVEQSEA